MLDASERLIYTYYVFLLKHQNESIKALSNKIKLFRSNLYCVRWVNWISLGLVFSKVKWISLTFVRCAKIYFMFVFFKSLQKLRTIPFERFFIFLPPFLWPNLWIINDIYKINQLDISWINHPERSLGEGLQILGLMLKVFETIILEII